MNPKIISSDCKSIIFSFSFSLVHSWLSWHRGAPLLVHPSHQSQVGAQEPEADVGPLGQPLHRPERQAAADRKSGCRLDQRKRSHFWLLLVAVMYLFLQFRHLKFLKFLKFQFFFWQLIFFVTLIILNWNIREYQNFIFIHQPKKYKAIEWKITKIKIHRKNVSVNS